MFSEHMLLFFVIFIGIHESMSACPSAESIAPACMCRLAKSWHKFPTMTCSNLTNADELHSPIKYLKMSQQKMLSFDIYDSSLLYIPHALFKGTKIEQIQFVKSHIMSLSDSELAFEGLEDSLIKIRVEDSQYIAHWDWQQLRSHQKLQEIEVVRISMGSITEPLPELKELIKLVFVRAEIDYIVDLAFAKLQHLRYLDLSFNDITEISRSMLPLPANELKGLYLSNNKIETLPKDFFNRIPLIFEVDLGNNKLITLREDTFKIPFQKLFRLRLQGNKLRCDCRLRWLDGLIPPFEFRGTCADPPSLAGKELKFVDFGELWC